MAHGSHDDEKNLPQVWPFTFAGLLLLAALVWFCLGFALRDRKLPEPAETTGPTSLPSHLPIFWGLLALGLAFVVFGGLLNYARDRSRR